jgi:hypothetical protein
VEFRELLKIRGLAEQVTPGCRRANVGLTKTRAAEHPQRSAGRIRRSERNARARIGNNLTANALTRASWTTRHPARTTVVSRERAQQVGDAVEVGALFREILALRREVPSHLGLPIGQRAATRSS